MSAGDCEQKAFAYAFTKDSSVDAVKVSDAERIQAQVRKCFQPLVTVILLQYSHSVSKYSNSFSQYSHSINHCFSCAESARMIAKLSLAVGDNLFDAVEVELTAFCTKLNNRQCRKWYFEMYVQLYCTCICMQLLQEILITDRMNTYV